MNANANWKTNLDETLRLLESGTPSLDTPESGDCLTPQGILHLECVGIDTFACQFTAVSLACPSTAAWASQELEQLSDRLAQTLRYLLEPIAAVELDKESAILQMRSNPPTEDEARGRQYYELVAQPGTLVLRRFEKQSGQPRQPIPMTFTRELFRRLAADMVDVLTGP